MYHFNLFLLNNLCTSKMLNISLIKPLQVLQGHFCIVILRSRFLQPIITKNTFDLVQLRFIVHKLIKCIADNY